MYIVWIQMAGELLIVCSFFVVKPRPWGESVGFHPSLSPAAESFTPLIGAYVAR